MKLAAIFLIGSIGLLVAEITDAGERHGDHHGRSTSERYHHKKHAHNEHKHHKESRRNKHRHHAHHGHRWDHVNDHHHGKRYDKHYHSKRKYRHDHSDAFVGGLVLGGIAGHAFHYDHSFCPDRRHAHRRNYRYGDYVWSHYDGRCYRVKRGRHGDVFVKVPRRRCY